MSQMRDRLRSEAIVSTFARLGNENLAMLKRTLKADYQIDLADDTFTLEELQIALQRIIGPGGADLILKEIRREIANQMLTCSISSEID